MRLLKAIAQAVACVLGMGLFVVFMACVEVWLGEGSSLLAIAALCFVGVVAAFYAQEKEKEIKK